MSIGDPRVLFCFGSERWLRAEAVGDLRRRCVAAGFEETDFARFSGPDFDPQAVLEAVQTAPFGSPRRLVLVDVEELKPDTLPWLQEYLRRPNPRSCLAVCADKCEKETEVAPPDLQRSGQVKLLWCLPMKGASLEAWVAQRCRQKGKVIDTRAAAELVRRTGASLQALDQALEALALLAGDSPGISEADVKSMVPPSIQQTAFEVMDAAVTGKTDRAALALREALAQGRMNMDQLWGAAGWYLRLGWKASRGAGAQGPWMPPERKEALSRLQRWPASRFQALLEELLRADARIKQGHPSPEWLADQLLLKLR